MACQEESTIKAALKARGWNHGDLMRALEAENITVSRAAVSNWTRGKRSPVEPTASAVARILSIEVTPGNPGRSRKLYEVYYVTSRRIRMQRSVSIRTPSGQSLAKGMESGNRGNIAPILVRGLKDAGRLAEWAVEAYSSAPEHIAHAQDLAIALRLELT